MLTLKSFTTDFRVDHHHATRTNALVVSLQQAGALVASICIAPITERVGRRPAIMGACAIFCIGVVMQVVPSHSLPVFYVGRVIAGLGLGGATTVVPIYSVEMAPKEIRGQLGSFMQWLFTFGVFTSYWIDYAVLKTLPATSRQWQIPVGLQMLPAGALGLGLITQKESARWLVKKGRPDEAWESLKWMRADDSVEVQTEFNAIQIGLEQELRATEGFRSRELLEPANRRRLFIAFTMFLSQQCTGATALAYFGPQFFKILVGAGDKDLLITALFGVVKVVACSLFVIFFSDRFDRKVIFIAGALGMSVCMIIVSTLDKVFPPDPSSTGKVTSAGMAMVAMIFLNIFIYNFSWGPLPWPYVAEIFPSRIREIGVSTGTSTQWLFNFTFSLVTPYMIASLGWGTFLFYAVLDIAMAIFVFFFVRETRGKSIEQMEEVFQSRAAFDVGLANKTIDDEARTTGFDKDAGHVHVERRDLPASQG